MSGRQWLWIPSEVLLVVTSLVSVLMLNRIFVDSSFVAPVVFTTLVAHGLLIALRRAGFGALATGSLL